MTEGSTIIVSGLIYWLHDKRREKKNLIQFQQQRKDLLHFFKNFDLYRNDIEKMMSYFNDIGNYRSNNIKEALKKAGIGALKYHGNAPVSLIPDRQLNDFTEKEIKQIIKDIKAGAYDSTFI